ncbi:transcription initiation factor TFIID subunit 7 [Aethina tumida]|uniref:transcription initiation factor TFIID subunit 7 n=1 Tax=Aethina tumida TaxID=116153 RepID=UPI00096B5971|nr:transcription initiation factor TFIID subunit 7 [Aethina tumida]
MYEETVELEEQFILRLPKKEADHVRQILHTKPKKIQKYLSIDLDVINKSGYVNCGDVRLNGVLRKLPTIVETYKTNLADNKDLLYKTADISGILQCDYIKDGEEQVKDVPVEMQHGYAPPMKNCRKAKFRKMTKNTDEAVEVEGVERELVFLFRTDYDAVTTRYELIEEDAKPVDVADLEMELLGPMSESDDD